MIATTTSATVHGPTPTSLAGREGSRYWVHSPFTFTEHAEADERLAGYPVLVFQPQGRAPADTPVVIGLQGIAAPLQGNAFLVPTLLDMGIACVLFDTPLAGERSLVGNFRGIVNEVVPLIKRRVRIGVALVPRLMEAVARDFHTVLDLIGERHGLSAERLALFGVSLGALLSSFAFLRDGVGDRLLCVIGHPDMPRFARSYAPRLTPVIASLPGRLVGRVASLCRVPLVRATTDFLHVLRQLKGKGPHALAANPMAYAERCGPERPVRILLGGADPLVRVADAQNAARQFPDAQCYVVPGLGHGGNGFEQHVRNFLGTQLGDWKW
jgi:pimeloyl-ACP methyl ester carboxylesterase